MDFEGAVIFAFGLIEEEINNRVVYFLFHLVFGCQTHSIFNAEIKKEEDLLVF